MDLVAVRVFLLHVLVGHRDGLGPVRLEGAQGVPFPARGDRLLESALLLLRHHPGPGVALRLDHVGLADAHRRHRT